MQDLTDNLNDVLLHIRNIRSQKHKFAEEQTKTAYVMPLFQALGYNVFNPFEFTPEYTCDIGIKQGEKVDYAIIEHNTPVILIEVKKENAKLCTQQYGQLFRYFTVTNCHLAILTDGIVYQFYSDIDKPNIMDNKAFTTFDLISDKPEKYLDVLTHIQKDNIDINALKIMAIQHSKPINSTYNTHIKHINENINITKPSHNIQSDIIEMLKHHNNINYQQTTTDQYDYIIIRRTTAKSNSYLNLTSIDIPICSIKTDTRSGITTFENFTGIKKNSKILKHIAEIEQIINTSDT